MYVCSVIDFRLYITITISTIADYLHIIITLRSCARGKAIGLSICHRRRRCCRQHENRQILSSRCLYNQLVDISEKLVYTRLEFLKKAY